MLVKTTNLPVEILNKLTALDLTKPAFCRSNSLMASIWSVTAMPTSQFSYVLGWVTHPDDNIRTQHAFLECNGVYYDATLQAKVIELAQLNKSFTHEVVHVISPKEIEELLLSTVGQTELQKMRDGKIAWPNLIMSGNSYKFDV